MQRVTIVLDDDLMEELDRLIALRGYQNRSEAIRDLARAGIRQAAQDSGAVRQCAAALVYVYDHGARELSKRLVNYFHGHHDLALATMHIHLDHENCLEVTAMRGPTDEVQHVADRVIAERGVRYGRLVTLPVEVAAETHSHGGGARRKHPHIHVRQAG